MLYYAVTGAYLQAIDVPKHLAYYMVAVVTIRWKSRNFILPLCMHLLKLVKLVFPVYHTGH